jgi:hypothetical protein
MYQCTFQMKRVLLKQTAKEKIKLRSTDTSRVCSYLYSVWNKLGTHSEVSSKHFWYSPHWLKYSALQAKRSVLFFSVCMKEGLEGLLLQLSFSTSLNLASMTHSLSYCDKGLTLVLEKHIDLLKQIDYLEIIVWIILTSIHCSCACSPFLSSKSRMKRATYLQDQIARRKVDLFLQCSSKYKTFEY